MRVIISNGSFKFHLAPAAAELSQAGYLARLITAGYPKRRFRQFVSQTGLKRYPAIARLIDRAENIPEDTITALWLPEFLFRVAVFASRFGARVRQPIEDLALGFYARSTAQIVSQVDADLYHYRSGYGRVSLAEARKHNMVTLCDHSIAHPALVDFFVSNQGRYPESAQHVQQLLKQSPYALFWTRILEDAMAADHILVNSDFVRDTLVFCGMARERIHVIYLGVDDKFLMNVIDRSEKTPPAGPIQLMFAGGVVARKGIDTLIKAIRQLGELDWRLTIAGGGDAAIFNTYAEFFADARVTYKGILSRTDLAREMAHAEIFIFPSLAEGSARVVFEALAAGCYVITTPNSGSIVSNEIHGALVPPGDADALANAIRHAAIDRVATHSIGVANQKLVKQEYRQQDYGRKLINLYQQLLTMRQSSIKS